MTALSDLCIAAAKAADVRTQGPYLSGTYRPGYGTDHHYAHGLWAKVYLAHRDSDALDRSNKRVIEATMAPFIAHGRDAHEDDERCWAHGTQCVLWIRVTTRLGRYTRAWQVYARLWARLQDYPVLDDEDFSREEREEADLTWERCYSPQERLDYLRSHWDEIEMSGWTLADLMRCVRRGDNGAPYTNSGYQDFLS